MPTSGFLRGYPRLQPGEETKLLRSRARNAGSPLSGTTLSVAAGTLTADHGGEADPGAGMARRGVRGRVAVLPA